MARHSSLFAIIYIVLLFSGTETVAEDTSQIQLTPGSTFTLNFPELGKMWRPDEPCKCEVYIPPDYTPDRPFPLLVWLAGGYGTYKVWRPKAMSGGKKFVCVMLPYKKPEGEQRLNCANDSWVSASKTGGWVSDWAYYKTMLDKVEEVVPNINPKKRLLGGFSSGGWAVLYTIQYSNGECQKYFSGYIVGGAGAPLGSLKSIAGKPMLVYCGDEDKRFHSLKSVYDVAKENGVDVTLLVFKNTKHDIPKKYHPDFVKWMNNNFLHHGLLDSYANLNKSITDKNWQQASIDVKAVLNASELGMKEYEYAQKQLPAITNKGNELATELLKKKPSVDDLRQFIDDWMDYPCVNDVRNALNDIGVKKLNEILPTGNMKLSISKRKALRKKLHAFLPEWENLPVYDDALNALDALGRKELEKLQKKAPASKIGTKLQAFISDWTPAPCTKDAKAIMETISEKQLEAIQKKKAFASSKKSKLEKLIDDFPGTAAAEKAKTLLDK